jgi:hypothetical protein
VASGDWKTICHGGDQHLLDAGCECACDRNAISQSGGFDPMGKSLPSDELITASNDISRLMVWMQTGIRIAL